MKSPAILVGPMGAGKSTIGRLLASSIGCDFLDSDRVIEERTGADIPWIFDVEGEEGFRQREANVLSEILEGEPLVLATGGGIVMKEENRESMISSGWKVFYLSASIQQLVERTSKDKKRPLLQVNDPRAKIEELLTLRDPLYREVSDVVIQTDRRSPKAVVQEILSHLER